MPRSLRLAASAGLLAALAACAQPAPPPPIAATAPTPAVAAAPAAMAGSFDGVYRGTANGNAACHGNLSRTPIRVANGVASIQTAGAGRLEGQIAPDGSLVVVHGQESMRGQFSGDTFNGTVTFRSCGYTLNYSKR